MFSRMRRTAAEAGQSRMPNALRVLRVTAIALTKLVFEYSCRRGYTQNAERTPGEMR